MTASRPHLFHAFATFVPAGPQVRVVEMVRGFGSVYRHTFMAMDGRADAARLLGDEAETRTLEPPVTRGTLRRPLAMRRILAEERPDLLLTYNFGSFDSVLANLTLSGLPHVHHEDGFNIDEAAGQKWRRVLARRVCLPRCSRVVVCSQRLLDIALNSWKLPPGRVVLIPNGIHSERFGPGPTTSRERHGIPEDALVVGSVGHLRPVKNYVRLIEAFGKAESERGDRKEAHLLLVGDGPERSRLEAAVRTIGSAGGRVHFAGHREDLEQEYRAMDLFCISSDSEQHPVALLEAMATGLPTAATDVGDVRAVLPAEQGRFLVSIEAGDPGTVLAEKISELLADGDLRAWLGVANRRRVAEAYSFEGMLETYRTVYTEAMEARSY